MVIRFTKLNAAVASEGPAYEFTRKLFNFNNEPGDGIQIDIAYDAYRRFRGDFGNNLFNWPDNG